MYEYKVKSEGILKLIIFFTKLGKETRIKGRFNYPFSYEFLGDVGDEAGWDW